MAHTRLDVFGDVSVPCAALSKKDKALARALDAVGAPHIRRRSGGFDGLFRIIVEQQVSVASAQAIWARCCKRLSPMTAPTVLSGGEEDLKSCGLSGPKARYVIGLADAIESGDLDLMTLADLDNETASRSLQSIKGIGPWTAAIYLLFCESRIDIWPPGDVALLSAYRSARLRGPLPLMKEFDKKAQKWAPNRGLAAHILWTYYAQMRGRTPI